MLQADAQSEEVLPKNSTTKNYFVGTYLLRYLILLEVIRIAPKSPKTSLKFRNIPIFDISASHPVRFSKENSESHNKTETEKITTGLHYNGHLLFQKASTIN